MNILLQIIYKCSEWLMYIIAYLINEIHLNYFIMILTILITTILTCLISLILKLCGINDSIENDKKILKSCGINIENLNENENKNKLILKYKNVEDKLIK